MSELRSGLRIGQDAAGIIVDVGSDESRAHDGKEQQYPDFPASQKLHHGHISQT